MSAVFGFDLGGGSLKAARVSADGAILRRASRPTGDGTTPESLALSLAALREELSAGTDTATDAATYGLGFAGVLDEDGALCGSPNLPCLAGTRLGELAERALGCTVSIDNDANCAALAEGWVGAACGETDFMVLTLGTGLGSGLVLAGRVHRGGTGRGCEFGHTVIVQGGRSCGCGNLGCVEAYVSEAAAAAMLEKAHPELRALALARVRDGHGCAEALFALSEQGRADAAALVRDMVQALGTAIASAANALDIEHFVLAGGLAPAFLARRELLDASIAASLFARDSARVRVVEAKVGLWAGALGAARLAMLAS